MATPGGGPLGEHGRILRDAVLRLRRRARAHLLAKALLAAVAADLLYDLAGIGVALLTGRSITFSPFIVVVFAVFVVFALRATSLRAFSRRLDGEHGLKSRLAAAEEFRRSGRVPAAIVEAQARETLRSVDFAAIRRSLRFSPAAHLGAIAFSGGLLGLILWGFPGLFQPQGFLLRQGGALVSRFSHPQVDAPLLRASGGGGGGDEAAPGEAKPKSEERGKPAAGEDRKQPEPPEREAREKPREQVAGKKPERRPEQAKPPGDPREGPGKAKPPSPPQGPRKGGGAAGAAAPEKLASVEVTRKPSPLAARPRPGLAPEGVRLDPRAGGAYLPPIPLFRLLAGSRGGALVDPDTVQIVPGAYDARYRRHIIAYFEKLQALRGGTDGS